MHYNPTCDSIWWSQRYTPMKHNPKYWYNSNFLLFVISPPYLARADMVLGTTLQKVVTLRCLVLAHAKAMKQCIRLWLVCKTHILRVAIFVMSILHVRSNCKIELKLSRWYKQVMQNCSLQPFFSVTLLLLVGNLKVRWKPTKNKYIYIYKCRLDTKELKSTQSKDCKFAVWCL